LEGLEISEVNYSKIVTENRYDSEYFQNKFIVAENYLLNKHHFRLGEKFKVTDGEHGSVEIQETGVKYLTAENIKKGYVDVTNIRYVSNDVNKRNARASVNVGDILISIKGTLGEVAVAEKWLLPANMNRDVAIFKPLNIGVPNSEYIALFLMSYYGSLQSLRCGSGGVQQMLTLERLRKFLIPVFSNSLFDDVSAFYKESQDLKIKAHKAYTQAETLLLQEIGLQNFEPSKEPVNIKSFKESFYREGRIDSEYYLIKYEQLREKLKSYKFGYKTLGGICNTFRGNFVSEEFYNLENGIKYIRGADISSNQMSSDKLMTLSNGFKHSNELLTEKGDIVIALIGSVGTASLITADYSKSIISNNLGLIRLYDKQFNPIYIHLFLTHKKIGQLLFKQKEMRTAQPKISDKDIVDFPIPIIDYNKQEQIVALVEESFKLKAESERLLEVAKKAVEIAIEENEENALRFIKDNN